MVLWMMLVQMQYYRNLIIFYNIHKKIFNNSIKNIMSSFPPPITAMKLVVSTGTSPNVQTFEQTIPPSALSGTTTNRVRINDSLVNAVLSQPLGTPVSSSIVTTYEGFPSDSNTLTSTTDLGVIQAPPPTTNGGNGGGGGSGGSGGVSDSVIQETDISGYIELLCTIM